MAEVHAKIERLFERWGRFVFAHPWLVILGMAVLTVFFASGLPSLEMTASTESYLQEHDESREIYNRFRDQFGYEENIFVILPQEDPFNLEFLERLRAFHEDLEANLPSLDKVESLINARVTRGEGDELIVEDLFEVWPETEEDVARIRERALATKSYQNILLSKDGHFTTVTAYLTPGSYVPEGEAAAAAAEAESFAFEEDLETALGEEEGAPPIRSMDGEELYNLVETFDVIVARHRSKDFPMAIAGGPPMTYQVLESMSKNMTLFSTLSNVLILVLLFCLFRRASGVFFPYLVVSLPLMGTMGTMGLLGMPITPTTQIMPSLMIAVCIGDAIHLLSVFYGRFDRGDEKNEAMIYALGHSGLAVVMTSITTAGSLFSFFFSELAPLKGLGIVAPIGIMLALVYSVVLLPALIAVCPMKRRKVVVDEFGQINPLARWIIKLGDFSTQRPGLVVAIWSVFIVVGLYGAAHLRFSHAPQYWFPEDDPLRVGLQVANDEMGGVFTLELVVDTGEENGLYDPDVMNRIEILHEKTDGKTFGVTAVGKTTVGKTISVLDVLKETHQALNENDPEFYAVPQDRDAIAQELLLFESSGSEDLELLVDSQFQKARVSLFLPFQDSIYFISLCEQVRTLVDETMGDTATVEITGLITLYARTITAILISTVRAYSFALCVIIPLMILLIGNLRMGLISLIPNLAPIVMGMGMMYWIGAPLDMFSVMIGSIAIGVAVDDTIHFMHNFRRYYQEHGDARRAVHQTLETTGLALLIASIALSIGFFVFLLSSMSNIMYFGLVTGVTIIFALLADLMLSPALVTLVDRATKRSARKSLAKETKRAGSVASDPSWN